MSSLNESARHGLIYLHGFNVSFEDAAIRAVQIGFDLKVPGLTAFFSWPSKGTIGDYTADEASIEGCEHLIAQFLSSFVRESGAKQLHLIAHSMGNRGLLRAFQRIIEEFSEGSDVPFGQIILAAPDVDADVFKSLAKTYSKLSSRTTLYTSPADRAVGASKWIHSYDRVGLSPPVTVCDGIDTIEIPSFSLFDILGHGYYAEAEALLYDIFDLIRRNTDPSQRLRLAPEQTSDGQRYWRMNP